VLAPLPGLATGPKAAAALSMRALGFHQSILDGSLAVFETRGKALCMRQVCDHNAHMALVYLTHCFMTKDDRTGHSLNELSRFFCFAWRAYRLVRLSHKPFIMLLLMLLLLLVRYALTSCAPLDAVDFRDGARASGERRRARRDAQPRRHVQTHRGAVPGPLLQGKPVYDCGTKCCARVGVDGIVNLTVEIFFGDA